MKRLLLIILLLVSSHANALVTDQLMMVRSSQSFPETMATLQEAIAQQGYKLSRVQRVDIGLTRSGYQTDKYRIVFFGKTDEVHQLTKQHPDLVPYLPLKIAIFAEGDETLLITANPLAFAKMYPQKDLQRMFQRWYKDVKHILEVVQNAE